MIIIMTVSVPQFDFIELLTNFLAGIFGGAVYIMLLSLAVLVIVTCVTAITGKVKG